MPTFESFVNFLRKRTTTPQTSFESMAIFAKQQREMHVAKKKKKLLAMIEKALKNREFPYLARVVVGEDIPDSVLQELFDNRELMKELEVQVRLNCENNHGRMVKLSDLRPGYKIERRCDRCVKYNHRMCET